MSTRSKAPSPTSEVSQSDLGSMLLATVRSATRKDPGSYTAEYVTLLLRRHFRSADDYDQRQIVTEIEVCIALEKVSEIERSTWSAIVEEIRPPKAPFTIEYRCGRCRVVDVKLWRGVHGCKSKDGHELLCARCLAPGIEVDADGKAPEKIGGSSIMTDQVGSWLPAVPVGDTFWGYTSVPTADVRWWKALPTYAKPPGDRHDGDSGPGWDREIA